MAFLYHHRFLSLLAWALIGRQAQVLAQVPTITLDFYSKESCLTNSNDLDNLSKSIDIFKELGTMSLDENGHIKHSCASVIIDLEDWPRNGEGKYVTWLDTSPIQAGCQVIFYNTPQQDETMNPLLCSQFYRRIGPSTGCARLEFGQTFGFEYCCGTTCNVAVNEGGIPLRRSEPPSLDVAAVKRAPILSRESKLAKRECQFVRSDPNTQTTYGQQVKVGASQTCSDPQGCNWEVTYSDKYELKDSKGLNIGGSVELWEKITISLGGQFNWEHVEGKELSMKYKLGLAPGQSGFASFMPLLKCIKGTLSEGCATHPADDWYCIPAMSSGNPDGTWNTVITN